MFEIYIQDRFLTCINITHFILYQEVYFGAGVNNQTIQVSILNNQNSALPDRQFSIVLASPLNGLQLGNPSTGILFLVAHIFTSKTYDIKTRYHLQKYEVQTCTG